MSAGTFEGVNLYFTEGSANMTASQGSLYGEGTANGPLIICTGPGRLEASTLNPASLDCGPFHGMESV